MDYAVLFPGQGAQVVGMGERLFVDHPELLGEAADVVLGWSLRDACLGGPPDRLTSTQIAQPAIYAVSFAAWTEWRRHGAPAPRAAAGHSLGEYTALAAAGVFDFHTGLKIVAARGRAMATAASGVESGMAAVIGADPAALEEICATRRGDGGSIWVANLNAPGQVVVAGASADLAWMGENSAELGLRRVIPLEVSGAFHTPLMQPAVESFAATLDGVVLASPAFDVWSNADAAPYGRDVAGTLLRQLTSPVRFADTLSGMAAAGVTAFVHLGPGNVTAGMAKRAVPDAATAVAEDAAEMVGAAAAVGLSIE
jgi:malonyl CoA-acyl carrier protein transacylase